MKLFNLLIFSALFAFFSCSEMKSERVVLRHPNNTPATIEYFKTKDTTGAPAKIVRFYINGEKQDETYYNEKGQKEGKYSFWFDNGEKMIEANYVQDVFHGEYVLRNLEGNLQLEAQYDMGSPVGTWKYYDREGALQNQQNFSK